MAFRSDDISINTLIGNGSFIKGNMHVNGFIRIDGDIDGDIETDGAVIISENSKIKGNLTAKSAIIGGIILGDITTLESVKLLSSSAVIGDIITKKVQMEENVIFHGHCISISDEDIFEQRKNNFLQSKAIRKKAVL